MKPIALLCLALALGACADLTNNLAGKAYLGGEPAPGYMLVGGEYIKISAPTDVDLRLNAISTAPCSSPLALDVRVEGAGYTCYFVDGTSRVIRVHDGINAPTVMRDRLVNGWASWNDDRTIGEIWLPAGSKAFQHELKHVREGDFHS